MFGGLGFIFLMLWLAMIVPTVRILRRAGFSGWWSLVCFMPFGAVVGYWIFAFIRWPRQDSQSPLIAEQF